MKKTFCFLFIFVASAPCIAQWKNANLGAQILAFGVHDTNFFLSDVPGNNFHLVYRWVPTTPGLWIGADNGIDPTQGNVTSFASLGNYFFAGLTQSDGTHGPVFYSTNNGSTWTEGNIGGPIGTNGAYLFGCSSTTVYRSVNGGNSWQGVPCSAASSFAAMGAYIFAKTSNGIWCSTDSGGHWSQLSPPFTGTITVMGTRLFIPGNGKLAISTDSGTQWSTIAVDSAGVPKMVNCLANDGKNLFVGTPTGILVSTDTGKNWTAENDSLTYKDISAIGVFDTLLFIDVSNIGPNSDFAAYYRPISEITKADTPESVVQAQSPDSLSIYPNPASGIVTIISRGTSIEQITVLNILGEEVLSIPDSHVSEINLDISKIPSGTYFLQIQTSEGVVLRKIVKEE